MQWRNFAKVIDRAKLACQNSGRSIEDDFAEVSKIVEAGATQKKVIDVADYFNQLDEDNKRPVIRGDIKQWNQMLLEAAHNAGVITNEEYADEVGSKVRKAIGDIGGTMPEDLPRPEKSIKQIEKEQLKRLKDKKIKLMLDE